MDLMLMELAKPVETRQSSKLPSVTDKAQGEQRTRSPFNRMCPLSSTQPPALMLLPLLSRAKSGYKYVIHDSRTCARLDAEFIKRLEETSLHELVKNKEGCYAVSGFEMIETTIAASVHD